MAKRVKVVNEFGTACKGTTAVNARMLLKQGLAKVECIEDGTTTIKLTTIFRSQAFKQIKKLNIKKTNTCWGCGRECISERPSQFRNWCAECAEKRDIQRKQDVEAYIALRINFMLDRAMHLLENQEFKIDIMDYHEAYDAIRERIVKDPSSFDSAYEMVAAMELINNRIRTKIHPLVAGRKPDFMLPELNIVLEVDGYLHNFKQAKDKEFDILMRQELGPQWEVIRIPTEYIEMNIKKLVPVIKALYKEMKKSRSENDGVLPPDFSQRDNQFCKSIQKRKKVNRAMFDEEWLWVTEHY